MESKASSMKEIARSFSPEPIEFESLFYTDVD